MALKDIKIDAEYLDILDEEGNPTGVSKSKDEIHETGDWHGTIQIWLANSKGEILMQRRSMEKKSRPGKWDNSCAGHISAGEDALTSALRELKEELGIEASEDQLEFLYNKKTEQIEQDGQFINHQHNFVYLATINLDIDNLKLQVEEVAEVKFIHHEELENHFRNETMDLGFYPGFYTDEINKLFPILKERFRK